MPVPVICSGNKEMKPNASAEAEHQTEGPLRGGPRDQQEMLRDPGSSNQVKPVPHQAWGNKKIVKS